MPPLTSTRAAVTGADAAAQQAWFRRPSANTGAQSQARCLGMSTPSTSSLGKQPKIFIKLNQQRTDQYVARYNFTKFLYRFCDTLTYVCNQEVGRTSQIFGNLFSLPVVGRDGKKVPKVFHNIRERPRSVLLLRNPIWDRRRPTMLSLAAWDIRPPRTSFLLIL